MIRNWRWTVLLSLGLFMADCSQDLSGGGGGFEGETVSFGGVVKNRRNRLAGATVDFLDLGTNNRLAGTITDAQGEFRLGVRPGSKGFLEIRSGDTALARRLVDMIPDAPLELDASFPTTWRARLVRSGSPVAGAAVRILGSTNSVTSGPDGGIELLRSQNPTEWAIVDLPDGTSREVVLPAVGDTQLVLPDHPSVLLDDFEGGGTRSSLGHAVGSGWWFATTDSASGGSSKAFPEGVLADFRIAYTTSDAHDRTGISVQFDVSQATMIHYCQLGLVLADTNSWMDLSKVDSISFFAKGSGEFRLLFGTRTSTEPELDPAGMTGADLVLPSVWTRMVVRASDIAPELNSRADDQNIPWSEESRQARTMVFFFKNSGTIQLDDIVFHGPTRSELIPRR